MTSVWMAECGIFSRMWLTSFRYASTVYPRFMFSSTSSSPACTGTSICSHTFGNRATASRIRSVM